MAIFVAGLALSPGAAATAVGLPPVSPPVSVPPVTPPPILPAPVAPVPINSVLNVPPPPALGGSGAAASPGGPAPTGTAALAALSALLAEDQGSDSQPADDGRQGPRDNRGASRQSEELGRQQYVMTAQVDALGASQDAEQAVFAGGGSGLFAWPEHFRTISQGFGCTSLRLAPSSGACPSGHFHTGDDIAGPDQSEVFAADTGVVRVFPGVAGYGNYAIVTHGNGFATLYGHLHDLAVNDGDLVQRGDLIAHEGSTGNSTGPHLHFEVRQAGGYLDPCPFLEDCGKPATPPVSVAPSVSGSSASGRSSRLV